MEKEMVIEKKKEKMAMEKKKEMAVMPRSYISTASPGRALVALPPVQQHHGCSSRSGSPSIDSSSGGGHLSLNRSIIAASAGQPPSPSHLQQENPLPHPCLPRVCSRSTAATSSLLLLRQSRARPRPRERASGKDATRQACHGLVVSFPFAPSRWPEMSAATGHLGPRSERQGCPRESPARVGPVPGSAMWWRCWNAPLLHRSTCSCSSQVSRKHIFSSSPITRR